MPHDLGIASLFIAIVFSILFVPFVIFEIKDASEYLKAKIESKEE
jgi:hypothetical protein